MAEFHFLRPLWLLLLPLAIWAAWRAGLGRGGQDRWRAVVDRGLQPHVLVAAGATAERRWPLAVALAAAVLAILALSGPAWDRLPVPAYRSDEALVVALDLSRSMDAGDVAPSRLARARLKLLDLLERRVGGQTALVVFSSNAFTVTPLTTDTRTIASLVNALSTDIMPSQGSLIEVGLDKAASLLTQSGATRGEILLLSDAQASPDAFERAAELAGGGIRIHVLAVGTPDGAPIPRADGGFVTDGRGQVVVPVLDVGNLERLAAAGEGRFVRLTIDDTDLDRLFPDPAAAGARADGEPGATGEGEVEVDIWRDNGVWLALALLPLLALAFRRGFVYVALVFVLLPLPEAQAFSPGDLWQRRDQQGMRALERDAPTEAAELFEDPEWSAVANYRAGNFGDSAAALEGIDAPEAHYNRGNALAKAGQLAEAIAAYDRALELAPGHEDARFNRELVAKLLEQQQQQQQQQQQSGEQPNPETGEGSADGGQAESPSNPDAGDGEGEQGGQDQAMAGADPSAAPEDPQGGSSDAEGGETDAEDNPGEPEAADESGPDGEQPAVAAASSEAVDDWASEQAAEQWLRRIAQDPGGLLRRKFLYQYQQLGVDQDGNRIFRGTEAEPW